MKRIMKLLLILTLVLTLLPVGALALDEASAELAAVEAEIIELPAAEALVPEEDIENAPKSGECGENLTWKFEDGVLTISGTGAMTDYDRSADAPNPWYALSFVITSVVIEPGVTTIGDEAFIICLNLTSVTLPKGIASIGRSAFNHCDALEGIDLPNGLTSIGTSAFDTCYNMKAISIPDSVTSIGNFAFAFCTALESVELPSGITSIGEYAFGECHNLKSVTIPGSVTAIGSAAFEGCRSLACVTFRGDAPVFEECAGIFAGVTATVYHPAGNGTWTDEVKEQLGQNANLTWVGGSNDIKGDINGDDEVTLKDVTRLFQYVNKQIATLGDADGDMNGDGEVTLKDVTKLFQFVNKQISTLG